MWIAFKHERDWRGDYVADSGRRSPTIIVKQERLDDPYNSCTRLLYRNETFTMTKYLYGG
jgi:hypothetical protein